MKFFQNQAYPGRAFLWQTEVEEHIAGINAKFKKKKKEITAGVQKTLILRQA